MLMYSDFSSAPACTVSEIVTQLLIRNCNSWSIARFANFEIGSIGYLYAQEHTIRQKAATTNSTCAIADSNQWLCFDGIRRSHLSVESACQISLMQCCSEVVDIKHLDRYVGLRFIPEQERNIEPCLCTGNIRDDITVELDLSSVEDCRSNERRTWHPRHISCRKQHPDYILTT